MATTYTFREVVKIANAAGMDAGNRSAKRNNRKAWNEADRDAAIEANNAVMFRMGFGHLIEE